MLPSYTRSTSAPSRSVCFRLRHRILSFSSLTALSSTLVLLIFAQVALVSTSSAQSCQYSPYWGENGELWNPNGPLKDYSHVGYHEGNDPIPYQKRAASKSFGPGRFTITQPIVLTSGVLRGAGKDQTTLYFPNGMVGMGYPCNVAPHPAGNCWDWNPGVIRSTGREIGIEDLTIEFGPHSYQHHNGQGFNGPSLYQCSHCWIKNVRVLNVDEGPSSHWGDHNTIEDVDIVGGYHAYAHMTGTLQTLMTNFTVSGGSIHGLTGAWDTHYGVFSNGGGSSVRIQPTENCAQCSAGAGGPPATEMLYSNIQGSGIYVDQFFPEYNHFLWNVGNQNLCPTDIQEAQLAMRLGDSPPVADAGPDQTVAVGKATTFDGRGSSDPDGDAFTFQWGFGDGTTASGAVVTHAYAASGIYTVTLTVSDGHLNDTDTVTIVVNGSSSTPCAVANLARCATASASSVWSASYDAAKATDGNGSTRWNSASGQTTGAWLALDFGALTTFDTVVLKEAITRITGYTLQYWDGTGWQTMASGTSIGASKSHAFAALTVEWVRLSVTSTISGGDTGTPTIAEFEVYNSADAEEPACAFANLARCATAAASSIWSAGYEAAKASDGNEGTRWNSANGQTAGAWLALDFGTIETFTTIVVKEAITRITGYRLQYWDGSGWRDIVTGSSIGASKTHTFAALNAQRVRLSVTSTVSSSSTGTPTIAEFEVY